jgi:hypothetical protein
MQWNWNSLGEEVERTRRGCVPRGEPGHEEAAERFKRAFRDVWPPDFFDRLKRCKEGEASALNDILDFIEACPRFFRSGYTLDEALRCVVRPPRTEMQTERMRGLVLAAVTRRLGLPFRRIPRLARNVDSPGLRKRLLALVDDADPVVRKRASVVLDVLPGPPWNAEHVGERRADDRIRAMVVTANTRRSPALVRRVLAVDPLTLTSRGRKYLGSSFELAMNLALIPDDELLEIAKRLEGPEMAPIWKFALARLDAPGDRARWLLKHLRPPATDHQPL